MMAHAFLVKQPLGLVTGPHGQLRYLVNSRGVRLAVYCWPVVSPKGVVHILHGHGSYLGYEYLKLQECGVPPVYANSWVESLNQAGYSVIGIDNQGAGRSSGLRAYCGSFEEYEDDIILSAQFSPLLGVPGLEASLPRFAMGASKGGCLAVMTALRHPGIFQGVALLAPMLSLEKVSQTAQNRVLRPLGMVLNALIPAAPIVATQKNTMHPELQRNFDADEACYHGGTRVRNASEYLRVTGYLMKNLHLVDFPFIVFHSENDTMTDSDGSKALFVGASSKDKKLRLVNHMWHIIPKEPGNEKILAEIVDFFDAHLQKQPASESDVDMSAGASDTDKD